MSGISYLLDTDFILGLLKSTPETLARIEHRQIDASQCAYSAITRMELLGFPGLTDDEENLIRQTLARLAYQAITPQVEDEAIHLRRSRNIKLPDAIIAASARVLGAELLTHDRKLHAMMSQERP